MESQINSLETRIEKMQERFNQDLEETKKKSKMAFCRGLTNSCEKKRKEKQRRKGKI